MKRIFICIFVLFIMSIFLASCDKTNDEDDDGPTYNYPKGAIVLTKDNFHDYFDLKVSTDENWWEYGKIFDTYVAIVPKEEYESAVGEINFTVNSYVYKYLKDVPTAHIVSGEQKLYLGNGVVNEKYTLRFQDNSDEYKVNSDSNTATLNSVKGYVILGEKAPITYDTLTDEQRQNSNSVLNELTNAVNTWKPLYEDADNYDYSGGITHYFSSFYGDDLSEKSSSSAYRNAIVDRGNFRYEVNGSKYYLNGDHTCIQSKQDNGMILTTSTGMTMDYLYEISSFVFEDLFDSNAVYIKNSENSYVAYTNLKIMQSGYWKEIIVDRLESRSLKKNYSKFEVKYTYEFDDDGFEFMIDVHHRDYKYNTKYYDLSVKCHQKIANINNAFVSLYTPENHDFLLCNTLAKSMATNAGMIEIDGNTTEISYTLYNPEDGYEGWGNPPYENYIPIRVKEGGVYHFDNAKFSSIYDEEGESHSGDYYEEGMYYVERRSVLYGVKKETTAVSSLIFEDYGDLNNPTIITDDSFNCYLEARNDMQAFSYTPKENGIYEFSKCNNLSISVYSSFDLENKLYIINTYNDMIISFKLEAGVTYIFKIENSTSDDPITYNGNITYIGIPGDSYNITEEWQEVFISADKDKELKVNVEISKPGEYRIEVDMISGKNVKSARFYTETGDSIDMDYYTYSDGVYIYSLKAGKYQAKFAAYDNSYIKANMRLVTVKTGVEEETHINISTNEYITLTTSVLPTIHSTSKFYFTVSETSKILMTKDSDFFTIYNLEGERISTIFYPYYIDKEFGNIEVNYSGELVPGEYYIQFESKKGEEVFTADIRLLIIDK